MKAALASKLLWAPGTRYRYSNAGYSLLAAVIEKVSGKTYEEFLRGQLFLPAGMEKTGYRLPAWSAREVAHGYGPEGDWGTPLDKAWAWTAPGGTFAATAASCPPWRPLQVAPRPEGEADPVQGREREGFHIHGCPRNEEAQLLRLRLGDRQDEAGHP